MTLIISGHQRERPEWIDGRLYMSVPSVNGAGELRVKATQYSAPITQSITITNQYFFL